MSASVNPMFRPGAQDLRAMNRALAWSIGVHVGVVLLVVLVPRNWLVTPPKQVMTISLGGTAGPRSTGTTSIGGRTVEQVAPPQRRPEPIRPVPPAKPEPTPAVVKTAPLPIRQAPRVDTPQPRAVRPPTTGPQVVQGNTPADTGARGQGQGLTFGGGGTGGETNLSDFCCPEYLQFLTGEIDRNWQRAQPQRGSTTVRFTILRDGTVTDMKVIQPSGSSLLDRASQRALLESKFPPLPSAYSSDKLTVNLTFPYEGH